MALQMQPGWVTPAQLNELISERAERDPAFGRNVRALNTGRDNDWRKWPAHLRQDLFKKLGITAVVTPIGPGGEVVSDCAEEAASPLPCDRAIAGPTSGAPDLSGLQRFTPASAGMQQSANGPYVRLSDVHALLEAATPPTNRDAYPDSAPSA